MTRLNSAVTPESIQSMKIGGEMNLAQQKLNQEAAARAQQGQLARQKMQLEREGQQQRLASDQLDRQMQLDISRDRMAQAAYEAEENRRLQREGMTLDEQYRTSQAAEDKRRYEEGKRIKQEALEQQHKIRLAEIERQITIAQGDRDATLQQQQELQRLKQERAALSRKHMQATADLEGKREEFDRKSGIAIDRVIDSLESGQSHSRNVISSVTGSVDPMNFERNVETYGGTPSPNLVAFEGLSEGIFQGSFLWKDFSEEQKFMLLQMGYEPGDMSLSDLINRPDTGQGAATMFGMGRSVSDFTQELENKYVDAAVSALLPNDRDSAERLASTLRRGLKDVRGLGPSDSAEVERVVGEINNRAAALGVSPNVLADIMRGISDNVTAKSRAYAASGYHAITDVDGLFNIANADEVRPVMQRLPQSEQQIDIGGEHVDNWISSHFYSPKTANGFAALASGMQTSQEVIDELTLASDRENTAVEFIDILGDVDYADLDDALDLAEQLVGDQKALEGLEKDLEDFKSDESLRASASDFAADLSRTDTELAALRELLTKIEAAGL